VTVPTVPVILPDVPVTVTVYVPGVVPEFPPPPPPPPPPPLLPPPPHPIAPKAANSASTPSIASQLRRRRGIPISTMPASAVPADGHNSFLNSLLAVVAEELKIVNVELCAPAPVMVTELGDNVQVGGSLAAAGVTEQVRFTAPVNPLDGVTAMATVFPVVAPGSMLSEELPPPTTKVGAWVTVSAMVVDAVSEPEFPVIVTVTGLDVTSAAALAVKVNTLDPVAGFVPNDDVTPLGRPLAARVTAPLNPFDPDTVIVSVLLLP
jgi:hypothetical protein